MKLNKQIKDKIDDFFANITAEELYDVSIRKYSFVEDNSIEIMCEKFDKIKVEVYDSSFDESYNDVDDKGNNFALAA